MPKPSKNSKIVIALLLLCVVIAVVPIVFLGGSAEFGGSDDAAGTMVEEIDPTYQSWFTSPIETFFAGNELPGELESLLFCLQAAIGSGIFFFILGRLTMRTKLTRALTEAGIDCETALNKKS